VSRHAHTITLLGACSSRSHGDSNVFLAICLFIYFANESHASLQQDIHAPFTSSVFSPAASHIWSCEASGKLHGCCEGSGQGRKLSLYEVGTCAARALAQALHNDAYTTLGCSKLSMAGLNVAPQHLASQPHAPSSPGLVEAAVRLESLQPACCVISGATGLQTAAAVFHHR